MFFLPAEALCYLCLNFIMHVFGIHLLYWSSIRKRSLHHLYHITDIHWVCESFKAERWLVCKISSLRCSYWIPWVPISIIIMFEWYLSMKHKYSDPVLLNYIFMIINISFKRFNHVKRDKIVMFCYEVIVAHSYCYWGIILSILNAERSKDKNGRRLFNNVWLVEMSASQLRAGCDE